MDKKKENLEDKKNSPDVQVEETAKKDEIVEQEKKAEKQEETAKKEETAQKEGKKGKKSSKKEKEASSEKDDEKGGAVSKGEDKQARKISKKIVLIICLALFVVAGIAVGVIVGITANKGDVVVKMVEVTGSSYVCVKNTDDQDVVVRQIGTGTVTLSSDEESQNKSVADVNDVILQTGQFIKIVYDLKDIGPSNITMRFDVQTNKRENFNLYFMTDASDKKYVFNQYFSVDIKVGQTRQVVLYLEVVNPSVSGECDIVINNSFLDLGGGK